MMAAGGKEAVYGPGWRQPQGRARWGGGRDALARWGLTALALFFMLVFLLLPLVSVFAYAFRDGLKVFASAVSDADAMSAVKLTLLTICIAVPLNTLFGLAAAWAVTKHRFRGKTLLITLIDLPFTVSPVISGAIFVILFGPRGRLGVWFDEHSLEILFAPPSIVIATMFVTFPFVARELIPLMETQGIDDEEAALMLGASGLKTFWRVTLPNIKWGLVYGIILCTARAVGEFGAVSVVSGHIRGKTVTMPLQVEILYNEYAFAAAFSVASLLTLVSLVTLGLKSFAERRKITQAAAFGEETTKAKG